MLRCWRFLCQLIHNADDAGDGIAVFFLVIITIGTTAMVISVGTISYWGLEPSSGDGRGSPPKQVIIHGAEEDEANGIYYCTHEVNHFGGAPSRRDVFGNPLTPRGAYVKHGGELPMYLYCQKTESGVGWEWVISTDVMPVIIDRTPATKDFLYQAKEDEEHAPPFTGWKSKRGSVSTLISLVIDGKDEVPTMAKKYSSVTLVDQYPDELRDVTLSCQDKVEVPTYKLVLAACSPYFKALFAGPWKENGTSSINIPFSSKLVKTVLELFYAGIIDMDAVQNDPIQFIVFANKFDLPWLKEVAEKTWCAQSIDETIIKDLWQAARMYDCDKMKSRCLQYVTNHLPDADAHEAMSSLKDEEPSSWEEFETKFATWEEFCALQAEQDSGEDVDEDSDEDVDQGSDEDSE